MYMQGLLVREHLCRGQIAELRDRAAVAGRVHRSRRDQAVRKAVQWVPLRCRITPEARLVHEHTQCGDRRAKLDEAVQQAVLVLTGYAWNFRPMPSPTPRQIV